MTNCCRELRKYESKEGFNSKVKHGKVSLSLLNGSRGKVNFIKIMQREEEESKFYHDTRRKTFIFNPLKMLIKINR
jgi:hypothetical protein